jgi:hypothetical protein
VSPPPGDRLGNILVGDAKFGELGADGGGSANARRGENEFVSLDHDVEMARPSQRLDDFRGKRQLVLGCELCQHE